MFSPLFLIQFHGKPKSRRPEVLGFCSIVSTLPFASIFPRRYISGNHSCTAKLEKVMCSTPKTKMKKYRLKKILLGDCKKAAPEFHYYFQQSIKNSLLALSRQRALNMESLK